MGIRELSQAIFAPNPRLFVHALKWLVAIRCVTSADDVDQLGSIYEHLLEHLSTHSVLIPCLSRQERFPETKFSEDDVTATYLAIHE